MIVAAAPEKKDGCERGCKHLRVSPDDVRADTGLARVAFPRHKLFSFFLNWKLKKVRERYARRRTFCPEAGEAASIGIFSSHAALPSSRLSF
ncbi:hypothetical protein [Caballeronia sp. LZ028]|uniref:hypothetical protein n=1 Tax=Caballeronia sp. LZ028 TaxID=3038563 RepID=UPI0028590931|nr:hypothetical protein [Caballeronia sp. LZ028]MDR5770003.1 hypothetical protein [Caballeronia sp. LZ028]